MKISFILGDWSRNIGNAFFQLGGLHLLKKILPEADYMIISERPGYPSYWNPKGGNPEGFFDMAVHAGSDYLVFMGPLFRKETLKIWGNTLQEMDLNYTKLIFLGVAAMNYDDKSISSYRRFLKMFPPFIFTTRDRDTFRMLGDLAVHAYDGIDLGFYIPDYYQPSGFRNMSPIIAINFDKLPEPKITIHNKESICNFPDNGYQTTFEYHGQRWCIKFPFLRTKMSQSSRYLMFLEGLLFPGTEQPKLLEYRIVRTDHRPHPMIRRKTYRQNNVLVNDVPYPYFEVYKQAGLTLSNRIHACVAALSYGNQAMLFSTSPRIRMLDRLGLSDITSRPRTLNLKTLEDEKSNLEMFLSDCLNA